MIFWVILAAIFLIITFCLGVVFNFSSMISMIEEEEAKNDSDPR